MVHRAQASKDERLEIPRRPDWITLPEIQMVLERDVLPAYLACARWYPGHDATRISPAITNAIPLCDANLEGPWLVVFEAVQDGAIGRYLLPLHIEWESRSGRTVLSTVRQGEREGFLIDVSTDRTFVSLLLKNLVSGAVENNAQNTSSLEFKPTRDIRINTKARRVHAVKAEQSNSTAVVDHRYVVKTYRKLESGISPEIEMSRFLTDDAHFPNTPALCGSVQLVRGGQQPTPLAVVHSFVTNHGDAWSVSAACIERFLRARPAPRNQSPSFKDPQQVYQQHMKQIGKRVGELHIALASRKDIVEFRPERVVSEDVRQWTEEILVRSRRVCRSLGTMASRMGDDEGRGIANTLIRLSSLEEQLTRLMPPDVSALKIRHHGDLHLGQMLVTSDDIYIIDFEGEPSRQVSERRRKAPAARDVAGVIRSIDYSFMAAFHRWGATEDRQRLYPIFSTWRDWATETFLHEYCKAVRDSDLWPDGGVANGVLNFFLLEKAIYEVEYEMSYRPSWLGVPLSGIARILEGL
jgi:maltose alpha-D-glucosyltransferase/alpha-amylase